MSKPEPISLAVRQQARRRAPKASEPAPIMIDTASGRRSTASQATSSGRSRQETICPLRSASRLGGFQIPGQEQAAAEPNAGTTERG
jgi:hypothetical protein